MSTRTTEGESTFFNGSILVQDGVRKVVGELWSKVKKEVFNKNTTKCCHHCSISSSSTITLKTFHHAHGGHGEIIFESNTMEKLSSMGGDFSRGRRMGRIECDTLMKFARSGYVISGLLQKLENHEK